VKKHYYHIKLKKSPGGIGLVILAKGENSKVVLGRGKVNKKEDLELKVNGGKIDFISEDYKFAIIYKDDFERLERKWEKYQNIL